MSLGQTTSPQSTCLLTSHHRRLLSFPARPLFLSLPTSPTFTLPLLLPPRASSSVNGAVLKEEVVLGDDGDFLSVNRVPRWRWADSVRSVLPGGTWWELPEDVEVKLMAKPLTLWRALARMWDLVARDRWVVYSAFFALVLAALSAIAIPHYLTSSIFSAQSGNVPVFRRNIYLLLVLCLAAGVTSGVRGCCFGIANMILVKRMRERLYQTLLLQDISFFDEETVGDLTSRLGADCQQVSRVIGNDLNLILRNALQGIGALIFLLTLSWPLGLCTLAICSTLAVIMLIYGQYQKKIARLIQEYTASANEVAQEALSLMRTVRVYGTESPETGRFASLFVDLSGLFGSASCLLELTVIMTGALEKHAHDQKYHSFFSEAWMSHLALPEHQHSGEILSTAFLAVISVLIGGMYILSGRITAEQLTKFILYSEWLIYSTWWVGDNLSSLMQSVGASEKVFQLMDLPPSNQFISEGLKLPKLVGQIKFVDVSFYYPSRALVPVLQHLNLTVNPGEVVAIVGLSGSGKSTIVNLLLRLYEPTNGQVILDGVPLKDLDVKWLREKIGFVGQEPRLFRMDITSNIRYGCTRRVSQEDVEWAAKQAYAHDFIVSLPDGYKTIVDDDLLSGGQKQRIAIARALLRDPTILILDEATSALDAESEHNIKGVLRAVRSDSTSKRSIIVIAHRLSTIQAADRIVVMDSGKIVEMGSHDELLLNDGLYAQLTRRQADAVA